MNIHRNLAALVCAATLLAACGGGDDDSAAADEPAAPTVTTDDADSASDSTTDATSGSTTDTASESTDGSGDVVEGPVSTLSPEIPTEYEEGLSPVDVIGDHLPDYPDPPPENDAATGLPAPTLVGYDSHGEPIRIEPGADGPIMLVFLAHWCSHCNNEVPRLNELRDEGRFPDGLRIVAVLTGSRPDAPNWPPTEWVNDTMGWTYETLVDGVDLEIQDYIAYDAYGVGGFPFVTLVDADGNVATRWSGERAPDTVIDTIDEYLDL